MASIRRTPPAEVNKQQDWIQETTQKALASDIGAQKYEESSDEREVDRRRELSEIT